MTCTKDGTVLSVNRSLIELLGYTAKQLVGNHINVTLAKSAIVFAQLYFFPMIRVQQRVDEMYLRLANKNGVEIPVLINASLTQHAGNQIITCVIIHMKNRSEYENQLLMAKKIAEEALSDKNKVNARLIQTLKVLEESEQKLLKANQQNEKFKNDIQNELGLARQIQKRSLPGAFSNDRIEFESYYLATKELSGDIYGFYQINEHQYGIILLDVMGHGISSALITMSLQSLFQMLITKGAATNIVMKELDDYLNTLFCNNQDAWHYCTGICLIIDTGRQTIECTNAGHPPAIFQNSDGDQIELAATSPPIGTFEGMQFKTETIKYEKGSKVLLCTDGVSEPLGMRRLGSLLKKYQTDSIIHFKRRILRSLHMEKEKDMINDDQCFMLLHLK
jgi:sigma-B regulation protein RsbU (phosphoserine phosphatase)